MARSTPPDGDGALDSRRPAWVILPVARLDASLAFWHEALRIPVRLRTPRRAELQTEGVVLTLEEVENAEEAEGTAGRTEASESAGGRARVAYEVDDLDDAVERLRGWGLDPVELAPDPTLGRCVRLLDPDGHEVLVVEPPSR